MSTARRNPLARLAATISFATRIPLAGKAKDESHLAGLAPYLPAAGFVIGGVLALVCLSMNLIGVSQLFAAALLVFAWVTVTGGIHLEGMMDTADGIFSHRDRDRQLEIMSDSRVGNFGAMAGFLTVILKFAALASLPAASVMAVVFIVPAWARWCACFAIGRFPYLRQSGMGKIWHESTAYPGHAIAAAVLPLAVTAAASYLGWPAAPLAGIATVIPGVVFAHWVNSKLGGHTGDTYGATVEKSETAALSILALFAPLPSLAPLFS